MSLSMLPNLDYYFISLIVNKTPMMLMLAFNSCIGALPFSTLLITKHRKSSGHLEGFDLRFSNRSSYFNKLVSFMPIIHFKWCLPSVCKCISCFCIKIFRTTRVRCCKSPHHCFWYLWVIENNINLRHILNIVQYVVLIKQ